MKTIEDFFRVSIASSKHPGELEDCVLSLYNRLEFSQLPLVFRRGYGNSEKVLYCLNKIAMIKRLYFTISVITASQTQQGTCIQGKRK